MNSVLKPFLGFCFISVLWCSVSGTTARYDNYRLYRLTPNDGKHLLLLKDIEMNSDSYTFIMGPRTVNASVVLIVPPHKFADFDSMLNTESISYEIVSNDVQTLVDDESLIQTRISEKFGWKKYYSLKDIYEWIDNTLQQYPNVTSPINAGSTYEKRDLKGIKISYKTGNPGIFVEGGMHPREWISPAVTTFLINSLLSSKNESIRSIAENFDWYIIPNANPDGYVYSYTKDRFWRKTRTPYGRSCFGADPNRNWDFHFAEAGVSKNPCSNTYAGPKAFSEIEMKSYANYLTSIKDKIQTFISFHSYSQLLLFPYGHTAEKVKNFDDLMDIGTKTITALARRYNTKYQVGNWYDVLYPSSGMSMDWVYAVLSVPLAYSYELRPANWFPGFELPPREIIPTGLETVESIVAMLRRAEELGYYKRV